MTARSRMTQRALIQRYTPGAVDDSGNASAGSWATHIASQPIWLYGSTEREAVTAETTAVVTDLKAMVPLAAAITEQDRIAGIVDRRGTTVHAGVLGIETVLRKRTHLQLTLSQVQS
jgi:hypothetical protein